MYKTLPKIRFLQRNFQLKQACQIRFCSNDNKDAGGDGGGGKPMIDRKQIEREQRDRRIPVELETSIQYMNSDAFKETYKEYKIWELFRRNFKGQFSPAVPRLSCVGADGFLKTSNPCVVCRDRNLLVHHKNIELLKQFISPHTGYVYPNSLLCLCFDQYEKLCASVQLAKNYGLIDFEVPVRHYDYRYHYKQTIDNKKTKS